MCSKFEVCYMPVLCIKFYQKIRDQLNQQTKNKKFSYSIITAAHKCYAK